MGTCRCPMCGRKDCDTNHSSRSYWRVGLKKDEHGLIYGAKDKKHSHKVRRLREKNTWKKEMLGDNG